MENILVVLADDHPVVRLITRQFLQQAPGIQVIGEAANGVEALHLVNKLSPDVLLLDMEMPIMNGIEVARRLYAAQSPVRILALSAYDDPQYIQVMLDYGAAGYLVKDEGPESVIEAVRKIAHSEEKWISQATKKRMRITKG